MNLTLKQVISLIIAVLSALLLASTQLVDVFGPQTAHMIVGVSTLLNTVLGAILAIITSQAGTVKDTLAMPGVEGIQVNRQANQTLASIAVDPLQDKIQPTPQDAVKVNQIANSGV